MSEGMSPEAEEQIRYIAAMPAPGPFSEKAVGALCVALAEMDRLRAREALLNRRNAENAQTAAEIERERDQLKARLDGIGETREEWGYRFPGPGDPDEAGFGSEAAVRVSAKPGDRIMMRVVGEWRDIEREVPDA